MKKVFAFILAVLAVVFVNGPVIGTAEAARVAVIPIQIDETKVERSADFNGYYWDIMIEKFKYPEYELMDDEKVDAVVPEQGLTSYDKATLQNIAEKLDAEVVVAMKLDNVFERPLNMRREPYLECNMRGEYAGYNRLTGKYYYKKLYYIEEIEEVLTLKNDWQQNAFASNLRRYINRTIEVKKKQSKKDRKTIK